MSVNILRAAWEDLKQIEDNYLMEFDAQTAIKVSDHILDCIERLEDHPDSGSLTPDEWLNQQDYRMIICKQHVAIYRSVQNEIFIHHIADTRTDYTKLFRR